MGHPDSFTATCQRDGPGWIVHVHGLDRSVRTARLSQADAAARELIATHSHTDAASVRVAVEVLISESARAALDTAAAVTSAASDSAGSRLRARRRAVRHLADEGFEIRDIASLAGLSYGQVDQLLAGSGAAQVPAPERPRHTAQRGQGRGYQHEAVIYRRDAGFLPGVLPFVRDGVALGQPVLVAVIRRRISELKAALGVDADQVQFMDMGELGRNPARIIPAWQAFIEKNAGAGPIRGVGEPIWAGRRSEEILECQLHESLLNVAVDLDTPLWLRCPYDAEGVGLAVAFEALRSHPLLAQEAGVRESRQFEGASHAAAMFASELPPPPSDTDELLRFGPHGLGVVRDRVRRHAIGSGLTEDQAANLTVAIGELVMNSLKHGGGKGTLSIWRTEDALVCEVKDTGQVVDPLVGRRQPVLDMESGRGMWMVNQLCDLVQLRSNASGTTARVLSWT